MKKTAKKTFFISFFFIHTLWISTYASAQVCNTKQISRNILPNSFSYAEIQNLDSTTAAGAVTATATAPTINAVPGLTWNRCVYGQKWDSATKQCIGSPILLSWPEALKLAESMENIIDGSVWRVPNIKELNSILDLQCISPPYNLEIFPDTFASEAHGLWTSSPHVDNSASFTSAWYIDLHQGKLSYRNADGDISTKNFVRFVK